MDPEHVEHRLSLQCSLAQGSERRSIAPYLLIVRRI